MGLQNETFNHYYLYFLLCVFTSVVIHQSGFSEASFQFDEFLEGLFELIVEHGVDYRID